MEDIIMLRILISRRHISVMNLYIQNCLICVADINIWKNKGKTNIFFAVLGVGHNWFGAGRISQVLIHGPCIGPNSID